MYRSIPRAFLYFTLALAAFTVADAEAAIGPIGGGAISSLAHLSPVQRVQAGECWEPNGPDGPGYYPCGDGGGGVGLNPRNANPGARRLGAGAQSPALRGVGEPGVHASPGPQRGAAPASPGLAGVHGPSEAAGAHVAAHASPGATLGAGVHGPAEVPGAHIGASAAPKIAAGSPAAIPRITAPSPAPVGVGAVHAGGAVGAPHIGAPAAPALAGVHGAGGSGIGHR
jgi:hypothetical protein